VKTVEMWAYVDNDEITSYATGSGFDLVNGTHQKYLYFFLDENQLEDMLNNKIFEII
jgi:hypothetical protein